MKNKKYIIHFIDYFSMDYVEEEKQTELEYVMDRLSGYTAYKLCGDVYNENCMEAEIFDLIEAKNLNEALNKVNDYWIPIEVFTLIDLKTGKQYTEDNL